MKHPHPWLARLAKCGMVLGLAAGLAAAGVALLPPAANLAWIGSRQFAAWQGVASVGQAWAVGRGQLEDMAAVLVGPVGWLLAAGLLREVANGRFGWVGPADGLVRLARWPAAAGMAFAVLAAGGGIHHWVDPGDGRLGNEYHLVNRVRLAVADGRVYRLNVERTPGEASGSMGYGRSGPTSDPTEAARRMALCLCGESVTLFWAVRSVGVLFFLSGVVYCLARPGPNDET